MTGPLYRRWKASGRNLEKLMEDLTDDGMEVPGLVSRVLSTG